MAKKCFNCRYFATEDQGYSDLTVTNTEIHCLRKQHPGMPCEETYSWTTEEKTIESEFMAFAETCPDFEDAEGEEQVSLNVEFDSDTEDYAIDSELNDIAKKYFSE